jgi:hypothetical protein
MGKTRGKGGRRKDEEENIFSPRVRSLVYLIGVLIFITTLGKEQKNSTWPVRD